MTPPATSDSVQRSVALYRTLLVLYPRAHREAYGSLMLQCFQDTCRDATRRGGPGLPDVWRRTVPDLLLSATRERVTSGAPMSRESFVRFSGLAAMLGGALWLYAIVQIATLPLPYPGTHRESGAFVLLILPAMVLMTLGLAGTSARRLIAGRWTGLACTLAALVGVAVFSAVWFGLLPWAAGMLGYFLYLATFLVAALAAGRGNPTMAALLAFGAITQVLFNTEDHRAWFGLGIGLAWLTIGFRHLAFRPASRPLA